MKIEFSVDCANDLATGERTKAPTVNGCSAGLLHFVVVVVKNIKVLSSNSSGIKNIKALLRSSDTQQHIWDFYPMSKVCGESFPPLH